MNMLLLIVLLIQYSICVLLYIHSTLLKHLKALYNNIKNATELLLTTINGSITVHVLGTNAGQHVRMLNLWGTNGLPML